MRSSSAGQNPCGPLAPPRDRDRRPCEGSSEAGAARPAVCPRAAPRNSRKGFRGAEARRARHEPAGDTSANVYAIILVSAAERVPRPSTRCLEGGRAPMLHICRHNFSRRVLVWLFAVLAAPLTAPAATLEDSARELARKIAGALTAQDKVVLEFVNTSALSWNDQAQVEMALTGELQNHVGMAITEGEETARVTVTLSENIKELVWTAVIRQGDTYRTVLFPALRPPANPAVSGSLPVVLHAEKFWEGPQRTLDALTYSDDNAESWLALLWSDSLVIQKVGSEIRFRLEIPADPPVSREPGGLLVHLGSTFAVGLEWQMCTMGLDTRTLTECHSTRGPARARDPVELIFSSEVAFPPGKGGQAAKIRNECTGTDLFLLTGLGDDTEPDSIQAFQKSSSGAIAGSNEVYLPGPVVALHFLSEFPRAIIRNLKTGNYEAYRLFTSCAQ